MKFKEKRMKYNIKGEIALVTGGAQGIGRATAEAFAENGVKLVLCDINFAGVSQTAREIEEKYGVEVLPVKMDVSKSTDVEAGVAEGIEKFGHIDILLNCAGICIASMVVDTSEELWDKIIDIDLKSVFMLSKTVAKHMIEKGIKGRILTISSQASKVGEFGNGPYSVAKAGINTLTQVMAQELAPYGITTVAVCPGYVNTIIMQKVFQERGPLEGMSPDEYKNTLCSRVPLNRMAEPSEIGNFMAYLASEGAEYITGVAYTFAGGSTLF